MRKELYKALKERFEKIYVTENRYYIDRENENEAEQSERMEGDRERAIKHIDLWNRNVEFINQEVAWARPAVFVEFEPIRWKTIVEGIQYTAAPQIRLHIVTDWSEDPECLEALDFPDIIHEAIAGLEGSTFCDLTLSESHTNHNHEEIIESIEVYSYSAVRHFG